MTAICNGSDEVKRVFVCRLALFRHLHRLATMPLSMLMAQRDNFERVKQVRPLSAAGGYDPMELRNYMAAYEENTGGNLLAIAHNGNMSNGLMLGNTVEISNFSWDNSFGAPQLTTRCLTLISIPRNPLSITSARLKFPHPGGPPMTRSGLAFPWTTMSH